MSPHQRREYGHTGPLLILALLFNALVVVHLSRDLWFPIDLAAAVYLFGMGAVVLREPKKTTDMPAPNPGAVEHDRKRTEGYFRNDPGRPGGLVCPRCGHLS